MTTSPPKMVPVEDLPEPIRKALYELIAHAINEHTPAVHYNVTGVTVKGLALGDFEVVVQRL